MKRQPRRPNGSPTEHLHLRLDPELKARAADRAAAEGLTLSAAVVGLLERYTDPARPSPAPADTRNDH
jgi:predicted HicB family RNase H-like nuclease